MSENMFENVSSAEQDELDAEFEKWFWNAYEHQPKDLVQWARYWEELEMDEFDRRQMYPITDEPWY